MMKKPKMRYNEQTKMWRCTGDNCTHIAKLPQVAYLGHHNKVANYKQLRLVK